MLVGAIDQGTSSTRFLVFESGSGKLVASHQISVTQVYPKPGWVEMEPNKLFESTMECIENTCPKLNSTHHIKAIGIANQRETVVVWDKFTGEPLYNAIVWLDTRTADLADAYIKGTPTQSKDHFKRKTGLPIHPYFSALKIRWLLDNVEAVKKAKEKGSLLFGTVDCWLLWKMTDGKVHATDIGNASRTLLMNIQKREWSSELCNFFDIPMHILPEICSSAQMYGHVEEGSLKGIPISGCLPDQQAALLGHRCFRKGEAKTTFGTGAFLLCNTGKDVIWSDNGLLTTIAFQLGNEAPIIFALEGAGSFGGNVVHFLEKNLNFFEKESQVEQLASTVQDTNDVYFVPCFAGLYSPAWDPSARGAIYGLTLSSTRAHIALAALKAIAFETAEMVESVERDFNNSKHNICRLKIDGGMTHNHLFNQLQANALGRIIECAKLSEVSGWGAAVAAGIGAGLFSLEDVIEQETTKYQPKNSTEERNHEMHRWKEAVQRCRKWTAI